MDFQYLVRNIPALVANLSILFCSVWTKWTLMKHRKIGL